MTRKLDQVRFVRLRTMLMKRWITVLTIRERLNVSRRTAFRWLAMLATTRDSVYGDLVKRGSGDKTEYRLM